MIDCSNCGFPNPSSVRLSLCHNCGGFIPGETPPPVRPPPPPPPPPRRDYLRLIAWGSAAVATVVSAFFWFDQCHLVELKGNAMLVMGLVAFVSLIVLAVKTPYREEKWSAVVVVVLGTGINTWLLLDAAFKATTFASSSC